MKFGISMLSVVPVRRLPLEKSEMVTQILFGEVVEVLKNNLKGWVLIKCEWDGYLGWVSSNQLHDISEKKFQEYRISKFISAEILAPAMCDGHSRYIPFGATLPHFDEMTFKMMGQKFAFGGRVTFPDRIDDVHGYIRKMAMRLIHVPYLWGGRSPLGMDCSGFVQILYKHLNIPLPRDAYQQIMEGDDIGFVSTAQTGDLAFFRGHYSDKINHVGMVLDKRIIIHASGRVRIDKLDHHGIFNKDDGKYSHLLVGVRRFLPEIS